MESRPVKMRGKVVDGAAEIKVLMKHPMETGTRRDDAGAVIPAEFIEQVICKHNENVVLTADWGTSVSKKSLFCLQGKIGKAWRYYQGRLD
jgi:sulfur-oxidizing protein SoxZ